MPPKKKRCFPVTDAKAGIAKQYLIDNYTLSSDAAVDKCQNGHVLLIYYVQSSKSATATLKLINEKFGFKATLSNVSALISKTKRLYGAMAKPYAKRRFQELCKASFVYTAVYNTATTTKNERGVGQQNHVPLPSVSLQSDTSARCQTKPSAPCRTDPSEPCQSEPSAPCQIEPSASCLVEQSAPSSSTDQHSSYVDFTSKYNNKMRGVTSSPSELLLRNRLKFVSTSYSKLKSRHREQISLLKEKIRTNPKRIKHLNQTIKRKQATIQSLKQKLAQNSKGDLQKAKREIKHLNRRIQKIKKKNKEKVEKIKDEFTEKLKIKDDQIKALQQKTIEKLNENLLDRKYVSLQKDSTACKAIIDFAID